MKGIKKMAYEQNTFRVGYCKMCRQWDVLSKDDSCFECLGLTLPQKYQQLFNGYTPEKEG